MSILLLCMIVIVASLLLNTSERSRTDDLLLEITKADDRSLSRSHAMKVASSEDSARAPDQKLSSLRQRDFFLAGHERQVNRPSMTVMPLKWPPRSEGAS